MNIMDEILQTAQDIEKLTDVMLGKVKEYKALAGMPAEKPNGEIWKPEFGEDYWYIDNGDGEETGYHEGFYDKRVVEFGNYFETKEEAEFHAKVQKYTNLFRKYVDEHSEPLDWGRDDQDKYYSYYDYRISQIYFDCACRYKQQGTIYASSKEVLEEAISFVGKKNAIKYVLGVEK